MVPVLALIGYVIRFPSVTTSLYLLTVGAHSRRVAVDECSPPSCLLPRQKLSKSQKKKDKKKAQDAEREARIAAEKEAMGGLSATVHTRLQTIRAS
jgi:hypothetical protein